MTLILVLTICYVVPSIISSYCFLFQRTARKIIMYAGGSSSIALTNKFLPHWYHKLLLFSKVRYIPLIWLLFEDWKAAVGLYFGFGLINLIWPVDDYGNTQKIKRFFIKKMSSGTFDKIDEELFGWVIAAEKKMEEPEADFGWRQQIITWIQWSLLIPIGWVAYKFGGYLYTLILK